MLWSAGILDILHSRGAPVSGDEFNQNDEVNTHQNNVNQTEFRGGVFWQISYFLSSKLIFIKMTIYEINSIFDYLKS